MKKLTSLVLIIGTLTLLLGRFKYGLSVMALDRSHAIEELPSKYRDHFEKWKQQIIKGCDASEALGFSSDKKQVQRGVDLNLLIKANNGSLVFTRDDQFMVLSSYIPFTANSHRETLGSYKIDGEKNHIPMTSKLYRSTCSLYIFGQKVYEAPFVESFYIGAQWNSEKSNIPLGLVPEIKWSTPESIAQLNLAGLGDLLRQAFRPQIDAYQILEDTLEIEEEDARKFFKWDERFFSQGLLRIENEPSAIWGHIAGPSIWAQDVVLNSLFNGERKNFSLEVRLGLLEISLPGIQNYKDQGTLKVTLDVDWNKTNKDYIEIGLKPSDEPEIVPFDKNEALACLKERALGLKHVPSEFGLPSVEELFSVCKILDHRLETSASKNGLMKTLIPEIFTGINPSIELNYAGWDQVLVDSILETLWHEKNLQDELNPLRRSKVISDAAYYVEQLKKELASTKNIREDDEELIFRMGILWALRGIKVSPNRMHFILSAIDNSIDTFKTSSEKLLNDLSSNAYAFDDQLNFAHSLDRSYKVLAQKNLALSQKLHLSEFENNIFNHILEKVVSYQDLSDWFDKLGKMKSGMIKSAAHFSI